MGRGIFSGLGGLLAPDVPLWACELTATRVVAAQATADRKRVQRRSSVPLPFRALMGDLKEVNIVDAAGVRSAVARALNEAGFNGSEIAVVIPDDAVRVTLLTVDSFPSTVAEQEKFIRWKLKKSVPFNVEEAALSYQTLGKNGSLDLLVTLSPRAVTRQYEELMESFGLHPGIVVPSTLAAFNLLDRPAGDIFFVKAAPTSVTTSIFVDGRLRFYRKVPRQGLYEAVYPTFMYYQDKLEGAELREIVLCEDERSPGEPVALGHKLGVPVRKLSAPDLDDIYKPALGALQP